jgi:hypothetical protein
MQLKMRFLVDKEYSDNISQYNDLEFERIQQRFCHLIQKYLFLFHFSILIYCFALNLMNFLYFFHFLFNFFFQALNQSINYHYHHFQNYFIIPNFIFLYSFLYFHFSQIYFSN